MSCNAAGANCPMASIRRPGKLMDNSRFSDTYRKIKRDGPLESIRIRAAAGSPPALTPSRSPWGGVESSPTSARATAEPQRGLSGHCDCGGAPTVRRDRTPFCRFAPSAPGTPGVKTLPAATTTGRARSAMITAVIDCGATIISTISSSRSITTRSPGLPVAAVRCSFIWRARIFRRPPDAFR
jgi:hypothetical protein